MSGVCAWERVCVCVESPAAPAIHTGVGDTVFLVGNHDLGMAAFLGFAYDFYCVCVRAYVTQCSPNMECFAA